MAGRTTRGAFFSVIAASAEPPSAESMNHRSEAPWTHSQCGPEQPQSSYKTEVDAVACYVLVDKVANGFSQAADG
jgi:hypothetical protein